LNEDGKEGEVLSFRRKMAFKSIKERLDG